MAHTRTVYVTCPFCKGMLEVNTENGKVVRRFEPKEAPEGGDRLAAREIEPQPLAHDIRPLLVQDRRHSGPEFVPDDLRAPCNLPPNLGRSRTPETL